MKSIAYNKKSKKIYFFAGGAIVALVVGSFMYVYAFNGSILGWKRSQNSSINYQAPTDEQKKAGESTKQSVAPPSSDTKSNSNNDQPVSTTQSSNKASVTISITAMNQAAGNFQLRSLISAVSNSGTCTLTMSYNGRVVTKTAAIQALSSVSTCQGFDIPLSELAPGQWNITLSFENETIKGVVTTEWTIQ